MLTTFTYHVKVRIYFNYYFTLQRYNDSFIVDEVHTITSSYSNLQNINICRLYINVIFLSDITNIKGDCLRSGIFHGNNSKKPPSTLSCTLQLSPNEKAWRLFYPNYFTPILKKKSLTLRQNKRLSLLKVTHVHKIQHS